MADIKQAAEWMKQGIGVRRRDYPNRLVAFGFRCNVGRGKWAEGDYEGLIPVLNDDHPLSIADLLADDWEPVTTPTPEREEI